MGPRWPGLHRLSGPPSQKSPFPRHFHARVRCALDSLTSSRSAQCPGSTPHSTRSEQLMPRGASAHMAPVQPAVGLLAAVLLSSSCPQLRQLVLRAGENVRGGHTRHSSACGSGAYFPGSHARHPSSLASWVVRA
eukprot:5332976-Prymnesium_polylepis.1